MGMQINKLFFIGAILFLILFGTINGKTTIANTDCGKVSGLVEGDGLSVFRGIKYGVGERWKFSKTLKESGKCWEGISDCTKFRPVCPVKGNPTDEDCLYLNIWTRNMPVTNKTKLLPVAFYIHGGSSVFGDGNGEWGVPTSEFVEGLVVVTINFRLGAFGFLGLKELDSYSGTQSSGNYAVSDWLSSLQWVQNNIHNFGGDKGRVTIYGQSSGGTSVLELLGIQQSQGLFHSAWLMSSSVIVDDSAEVVQKINQQYLTKSGCLKNQNNQMGQKESERGSNNANTETSVLDCLLNLSTSQVLDASISSWFSNLLFDWPLKNEFVDPLMYVDGYYLKEKISTALQNKVIDVPVVIGYMAQESELGPAQNISGYTESQYQQYVHKVFDTFGVQISDRVLQLYPYSNYSDIQKAWEEIATDSRAICGSYQTYQSAMSTNFNSPVYSYVCDFKPNPSLYFGKKYLKYSFHGLDLLTMLGHYDRYGSHYANFGKVIRKLFLDFATNQKITQMDWPTFTAKNNNQNDDVSIPSVYYGIKLNENPTITKNLKSEKCKFWMENGFYEYSWVN
ncbi:carboxylesterase [Anaeramoeba flamelloides]|uniref:Carboxylic ester hydrolase n=1 Tax=Anaeramoeba flamelloides TaxID=1746091 RepID=A0ABQ8XVI0_9EUKA|nr:carboxylesterase [Anaeramoeba flamelloides]